MTKPIQLVRATRGDAGHASAGSVSAGAFTGGTGDVALAPNEVFITAQDGLHRADRALTAASKVPTLSDGYVAIHVDGDSLYLRSISKFIRTSRTSIDSPVTLAVVTSGVDGSSVHLAQIATDAKYAYVTANDGLYRSDKASSNQAVRIVDKKNVVGVAVDPSYVYFSVAPEKTLFRFKK